MDKQLMTALNEWHDAVVDAHPELYQKAYEAGADTEMLWHLQNVVGDLAVACDDNGDINYGEALNELFPLLLVQMAAQELKAGATLSGIPTKDPRYADEYNYLDI